MKLKLMMYGYNSVVESQFSIPKALSLTLNSEERGMDSPDERKRQRVNSKQLT